MTVLFAFIILVTIIFVWFQFQPYTRESIRNFYMVYQDKIWVGIILSLFIYAIIS